MNSCRQILIGLFCISLLGVPANADDSKSEAILKQLATEIEGELMEPSRLNVLANQSADLDLKAAAPLLSKALVRRLKIPTATDGAYSYHIARVAEAVCALGGREEYQSMVELFAAAPLGSGFQKAFSTTLLSYGCKYEIENAAARLAKQEIVFPEHDEVLPEHLKELPAELQDAWRYYRRTLVPFHEYSESATKGSVSADLNWPHFYSIIRSSLAGDKKDNFGQVASFQWGSWCGTGSQMLYAPKSRAMVLELVRGEHFAESVGAALELAPSGMGGSTVPTLAEFGWRRRLIESCGLDWERLFLGRVLEGSSVEDLRWLVAFGSEDTAKRLLALATSPSHDQFPLAKFLPVLTVMVEPAATGGLADETRHIARTKDSPEVSAEMQRAILDVLHSHLVSATDPRLVKSLVTELVRLGRPESISPLRRMAALPHYEVAKSAAEALRSMGVEIPLPEAPEDGCFRLFFADGKPLAGVQIKYSTTADGKSLTMSSGGKTTATGEFQVRGTLFADPRFNTSEIRFSSDSFKALDQTVFATDVTIPADRTEPINVPISTHALRLVLNNAPADGDVAVSLKFCGVFGRPASRTSFYMGMGGQVTTPLQEVLEFPQLGEGRYVISLDVPGRALWKSEEISMDEAKEVTADLLPGAALSFELAAPGGELADTQVQHKLIGLPGEEYYQYADYTNGGYRGLPVGDYTLKILSSAEKRDRHILRVGEKEFDDGHLPGDYSGKVIKFAITKDKPVVDLGKIELKPVDP